MPRSIIVISLFAVFLFTSGFGTCSVDRKVYKPQFPQAVLTVPQPTVQVERGAVLPEAPTFVASSVEQLLRSLPQPVQDKMEEAGCYLWINTQPREGEESARWDCDSIGPIPFSEAIPFIIDSIKQAYARTRTEKINETLMVMFENGLYTQVLVYNDRLRQYRKAMRIWTARMEFPETGEWRRYRIFGHRGGGVRRSHIQTEVFVVGASCVGWGCPGQKAERYVAAPTRK